MKHTPQEPDIIKSRYTRRPQASTTRTAAASRAPENNTPVDCSEPGMKEEKIHLGAHSRLSDVAGTEIVSRGDVSSVVGAG